MNEKPDCRSVQQESVEVAEASVSEKPILRQLLELYQYDFSEFEDTDVGPKGVYGYRYLRHYWSEEERHAYLIRVNRKIAGFVLVNRHGTSTEGARSVAEFFIMRKFRGRGIGETAAVIIFNLWPGKWEVKQVASHPGSTAFWRKVIGRYTNGRYEEQEAHWGAHSGIVQLFVAPPCSSFDAGHSADEAPISSN